MSVFQLRHKSAESRVYSLEKPRLTIGRQVEQVDIHIPSGMISRVHAFVTKGNDGDWYIEDNGSTNGTTLNGFYVNEPTRLNHGDVVVFGGENEEMIANFSFIFENRQQAATPQPSANPLSTPEKISLSQLSHQPTMINPAVMVPVAQQVTPPSIVQPPVISAPGVTSQPERKLPPGAVPIMPAPTVPTGNILVAPNIPAPQPPLQPVIQPPAEPKIERRDTLLSGSGSNLVGSSGTLEVPPSGGDPPSSPAKPRAHLGEDNSLAKSSPKESKGFKWGIKRPKSKANQSSTSLGNFENTIEIDPVISGSQAAVVKRLGHMTEDFCRLGSATDLDRVLKGVNVKKIPSCNRTPFAVAILAGNIKLAVRLLEVGADADLSNCELTEIPDVILRLVAAGVITKLDVSNNKLTLLPSGLISAKEVTFRGNPLTAVPQEYRDKWANYKRFLAKNEKGSQKLVVDDTPRRKILVVGAENTGKTSVTKALVAKGKIDVSKKVENEDVDVSQITMGKEAYTIWSLGRVCINTPMHRLYLDSDCFYLVTFNLAALSLPEIEYWLKTIKQTLLDRLAVVILVGTNADKLSDDEVNNTIETLRAKFPKHVFPALQDIVPVSCKSGAGISTLLKSIKSLSSHQMFQREVPLPYFQLQALLVKRRISGSEWITFSELQQIAADQAGLFTEQEVHQLLLYTNAIGATLYYYKQALKKIIFLGPEFLYKFQSRFQRTVEAANLPAGSDGIIPATLVENIFSSLDPELQDEVFKLFCKNRLISSIPSRKSFLVSFLIPQGPLYNISKEFPVKLPEEESCYGRVFKFQQYPIDLFQRVVVSTLNFPDVSAVRISDSGLLVSHRDCVRVNLQYLKNSYKILVELRFSTKNTSVEKIALAFWRQILENLRTQLECFCAGLSWNELIPCIHCIRRGVSRDKVYLMKYQEVIDRADQPFLYCHQIESFSRCIARTEVAPDISLCDLPQVSMKHLQIGEQIGEGGFGVVYKGSLNNGNQSIVVAVKELSAAGSEGFLDGDLFREFQIEAYIQSLLDHPNCVKLYGLTATPPRMILEFINGGDLCKLLHKSKDQGFTQETFPWAKRYQIAFDIVKGLHHMQSHDPPIIHRDIRSPNIFMSKDGRALIGDFGLARLVNPEVGGLLGTWQWLAPECIDSLETGSYDHRSDIYSFGMVLWEISSFAVPFEEFQDDLRYMQNGKLKLQELKRAIIDEHLRPTIPSTTPESIKGLIRRCWDANRDVRPSTREILEILASEMGCSDQVVAEINKPPPSPMDSRLSSHLVTFTPPTIRPECPFAAETFSASGKFRVLTAVPDNNTVWVGTSEGYIFLLSLEGKSIVTKKRWQAHGGRIASMVYYKFRVWSCSDDDGFVRVWNVTDLSIDASIKVSTDKENRAANLLVSVPQKNKIWAFSSQFKSLVIIDAISLEITSTRVEEEFFGMSAAIVHRDHVWVGNAGQIYMLDINTAEVVGSFPALNTGKAAMILCSSGEAVWTSSRDECRVWNAASIETLCLANEVNIGDSKWECFLAGPGGKIFSGGFNGELVMWDSFGVPLQEMLLTSRSIRDLTILGNHLWCTSTLNEVFVFPSHELHTKQKLIKVDLLNTIRAPGASKPKGVYSPGVPAPIKPGGIAPSERAKLMGNRASSSVGTAAPGRTKPKNTTMRQVEPENVGLSDEEVTRKLANPLVTLRKRNIPSNPDEFGAPPPSEPAPPPPVPVQLYTFDGRLLPCNLTVPANQRVISLIQKSIPLCFQQMGIFQPGTPFEVLYVSNGQPTRFLSSDLTKFVHQFINPPTLLVNFIPLDMLAAIVQNFRVSVYGILSNNLADPSASVQTADFD